LECRIHRNRELPTLSLMAFAIIQAVMTRLGERHNIPIAPRMNTAMTLIRALPALTLDTWEIHEQERPAIVTVPRYARSGAVAEPG